VDSIDGSMRAPSIPHPGAPPRGARLAARLVAVLLCAPIGAPACAQPATEVSGAGAAGSPVAPPADAPFADLIAALSEPGGWFDTDNLISNESSYGQVVELLEPTGGVYLGVGPEQNFHYIARLRPSWAFLVDIRRDNQLHHLLLAAILLRAEDPLAYLCLQFSRAPCEPAQPGDDLDATLARFARATPSEEGFEATLARLLATVTGELGVALDERDRASLRAIHRAFFEAQLELRFETFGRPLQLHHPTDRELIRARTPGGEPANFLATREGYETVRALARARRLVPVVGDFAGTHALPAIGAFAARLGERITTIYTSNVEYYLIDAGTFGRWIDNVRSLPLAGDARFVRACFHYGRSHPAALPGHRSTLVVQPVRDTLERAAAERWLGYWELCTLPWDEPDGSARRLEPARP
jgi:hypothetical protein